MRLFTLLVVLSGASAVAAQPAFTITPDTLYWDDATGFETPFVIRNTSGRTLQLDSLTIGFCSGPWCTDDFNPGYSVWFEHGDASYDGFIWPGRKTYWYPEPPSVSLAPGDSAGLYIGGIAGCPICDRGEPDHDTVAPVLFWGEGRPQPVVRLLAYAFPTATEPQAPTAPAALSVTGSNPFSVETALLLQLQVPAEVEAVLLDGLGRRVGALADGALGAGAHRLVVRADGLAPGLYFVRAAIRSGREASVATQRLFLLR